jgi:NADPH:quinone reductase-like Zn-dependent oxidoreductase
VHSPLSTYLAEKYSSEPFDAILDCVGIQKVYTDSPSYLKKDGLFVNVGAMEGLGAFIKSSAKNMLVPVFLGGTPRKYVFQQTNPTRERLQYLVGLVKEGKLSVIVDQVFEMEDALQVSTIITPLLIMLLHSLIPLQAYERILTQRAKGKVVVKIQDV